MVQQRVAPQHAQPLRSRRDYAVACTLPGRMHGSCSLVAWQGFTGQQHVQQQGSAAALGHAAARDAVAAWPSIMIMWPMHGAAVDSPWLVWQLP